MRPRTRPPQLLGKHRHRALLPQALPMRRQAWRWRPSHRHHVIDEDVEVAGSDTFADVTWHPSSAEWAEAPAAFLAPSSFDGSRPPTRAPELHIVDLAMGLLVGRKGSGGAAWTSRKSLRGCDGTVLGAAEGFSCGTILTPSSGLYSGRAPLMWGPDIFFLD